MRDMVARARQRVGWLLLAPLLCLAITSPLPRAHAGATALRQVPLLARSCCLECRWSLTPASPLGCYSHAQACSNVAPSSAQERVGDTTAHHRRLQQPKIDEARDEPGAGGAAAEADKGAGAAAATEEPLTLSASDRTGKRIYRRAGEVRREPERANVAAARRFLGAEPEASRAGCLAAPQLKTPARFVQPAGLPASRQCLLFAGQPTPRQKQQRSFERRALTPGPAEPRACWAASSTPVRGLTGRAWRPRSSACSTLPSPG